MNSWPQAGRENKWPLEISTNCTFSCPIISGSNKLKGSKFVFVTDQELGGRDGWATGLEMYQR